MATGPSTRVSDIVVPEIFDRYTQQRTTQKSTIITSGAVLPDEELSRKVAGGGLTFNAPSWRDLDDDDDNVSTDVAADKYTGTLQTGDSAPFKIGTDTEIAVRLNRNGSWGAARLAAALSGEDPLGAIVNLVGDWWVRRYQNIFLATAKGVFADNAAAPSGNDTHTQNDLTFDISTLNGGVFSDGVTNFSAEAFIDAALTMGDNEEALGMLMVHSVVHAQMKKNNLIDFLLDSEGKPTIKMFQGRRVIINDAMPASAGVYESWMFGQGAFRLGESPAEVPTAVGRDEDAGNGAGMDVLYSRRQLSLHPVGHAYIGTPANGGPSNAATTNNLAHASSWSRVWSERKAIPMARLITREA